MKIWFQNRRAKWKRVKAGLTTHGLARNNNNGGVPLGGCGGLGGGGGLGGNANGANGNGSNGGGGGSNKIVVPIPVHVNRFAVRSQHQHMEKMCLSGPKPDLRKDAAVKIEYTSSSGFERFAGMMGNAVEMLGKPF